MEEGHQLRGASVSFQLVLASLRRARLATAEYPGIRRTEPSACPVTHGLVAMA